MASLSTKSLSVFLFILKLELITRTKISCEDSLWQREWGVLGNVLQWFIPSFMCQYSMSLISGREQSMKPMIGKSIDQSMTIDALLVNWHRLASANRWPIDNHTKVVVTYRLSSIGVEKISLSQTFQPVRIRTRSTHKCLRFEFVHRIVCMLLHGFKNLQQKHTLKL